MPTRGEWRAALHRRWPLLWRALVAFALIVGITALWQVLQLESYTNLSALLDLGLAVREQPWAAPALIMAYIAAGFAFLPLTLMVVATLLVYGPLSGFALASIGTTASAIASFILGWVLGAEPVRRLAGPTLMRLNAHASNHGTMVVSALRIMPVAHFHAVSLLAGASTIRFTPYLIGTWLGTLPGIAALAAVSNQAKRFVLNPDARGLFVLALLGALSLIILYLLRLGMRHYANPSSDPSEDF